MGAQATDLAEASGRPLVLHDTPMRATIYLPDDLAQAVEAYLKDHPETSLSASVQEARLRRNPAALLEPAGVVEKATGSPREGAEDRLYPR